MVLTAVSEFLKALSTERLSENLRSVLLEFTAQNKDSCFLILAFS